LHRFEPGRPELPRLTLVPPRALRKACDIILEDSMLLTRRPWTRTPWHAVWTLAALLLAGNSLLPVDAFAKGKDKPAEETPSVDEDTIAGEAFVHMKLAFVKFTIDGKEWENHEYVDGQKTLVLRGLGRDAEHTVVLTPREGGYEPYTLTIKPAEFKKTVVKQKGSTKTLAFRATYKVDFKKAEAEKTGDKKDDKAGKDAAK